MFRILIGWKSASYQICLNQEITEVGLCALSFLIMIEYDAASKCQQCAIFEDVYYGEFLNILISDISFESDCQTFQVGNYCWPFLCYLKDKIDTFVLKRRDRVLQYVHAFSVQRRQMPTGRPANFILIVIGGQAVMSMQSCLSLKSPSLTITNPRYSVCLLFVVRIIVFAVQ